jgi:AraC-like DNA-binding protein
MTLRLSEAPRIAQTFFNHLLDEWRASGIGHDIERVLAGAGVSQRQIRQGDPKIRLHHYFRTLQLAAPLVVHTGFFLRLGRAYSLFDLGILGYALYSAANLRRSWDISLGRSNGLVPHPIMTGRRVTTEHAGILLYPPPIESAARTALCEEWLAGTWRWMCQRLPDLETCHRMAVHLDYAAPSYRAFYETLFPGAVHFNMPAPALLVPVEYYEQPFSSANLAIMRLCYQESVAAAAQFEHGDSFADEVRFYILQNARVPFPTRKKTAKAFHLPVHTLHRRLARSKTTFRRVTLEVKMLLAKQYLQETTLPIQVISHLIGYGQAASFVRAFRDWYGVTPSAFRKERG